MAHHSPAQASRGAAQPPVRPADLTAARAGAYTRAFRAMKRSIAILLPPAALLAGAGLLAPAAQISSPLAAQQDPETARRITPEVEVVRKAGPAVVYIETDVRVDVGYDWFTGRPVQREAVSS